MNEAAVTFRSVDIVFGTASRQRALALLDQGRTRDQILAETGQVVGVAGANLSVARGEICVLMGLSGSGKSTLLRSVNRLNAPVRGEVLVQHQGSTVNVTTCDGATLRALRGRSVAMVFQQFALLPWRTVRDNVGLGLEMRGLRGAERARIVDEKLHMVGLSRWAEKYGHELSGGMQQRVGLARAFATDADILLMDEPFSALDPLIRTKLQDELLALQAQLKKTILFVSHDLDEAMKLGNRIVIMEGGRIIQAGTPEDIVLRPADSYVAEFVRHMNPLEALRVSAVMTPLADLPRENGAVIACARTGMRVSLGDDDRLQGASAGAEMRPCNIVPLAETEGLLTRADAIVVPRDLPLKKAVAVRHSHDCPILVTGETGAFLGSIGENEILRALLRA